MNLLSKDKRGTLFQILAFVLLFFLCAVRGEIVQQLMGAGTFVLAVVVLVSPFFVLRKIAQWLCRGRWEIRYVRLAVDIAGAGLFILFVATISPSLTSLGHLSGCMENQIMAKWHEVGGWHGSWNEDLNDSMRKLETLSNVSWFLENFPLYVILPGVLALLGGYSMDRAKQAKKPASS